MNEKINRTAQAVRNNVRRNPRKTAFFGVSGIVIILFITDYLVNISANLVSSAIAPFLGLSP